MRTVINPPRLSTLLLGWLRGGLSVLLSVAVTWLIFGAMARMLAGSLVPFMIVAGALWTVLVNVQCLFEHTVTVTATDLEVRTWIGSLLGRPGRRFPLQQPELTLAPRSGRGGGGLRSSRMWLTDEHGQPHKITFTLIGFNGLAAQLAESGLVHNDPLRPPN